MQLRLFRAAPEHLRAATPLETQVYDVMIQGSPQAPSIVPKEAQQRLGRHYVELGQPPTDQERLDADEEIGSDEPPPPKRRNISAQPRRSSSSSSSANRSPSYTPSESQGEVESLPKGSDRSRS